MSQMTILCQKRHLMMVRIPCADPDEGTTLMLGQAAQQAGADVLELALPFSDPTADGPEIQAAFTRALDGGYSTAQGLALAHHLQDRLPVSLYAYANTVFAGGLESFLERAAHPDTVGLYLPDVPLEERSEFAPLCDHYRLRLPAQLIATDTARMEQIAAQASGHLRCEPQDLAAALPVARKAGLPLLVCVPDGEPEQIAAQVQGADGVILTTTIARLTAQYGRDATTHALEKLQRIRQLLILEEETIHVP